MTEELGTPSRQKVLSDFFSNLAKEALSLSESLLPPRQQNMLIKSANFRLIDYDESDRIFEGWGSVELVDKDGDLIPVDAIAEVMDTYMARGGVITDSHSSRIVGKMQDWNVKEREDGKKGLWLKGVIYNHYPVDDAVWHAIKTGTYEGFSLGGDAFEKFVECTDTECYNKIPKMALYEWSVVRVPANQGALIENVNLMAKSSIEKKMSWDECVSRMKEQYGADDKKVYATCNELASEGKVEPCPKGKEFVEKAHLFIDYATRKGLDRLYAHDILDKCIICKEYVDELIKIGLKKETALTLLQFELDQILTQNKEDKKMPEIIDKQEPPVPPGQPQGPQGLEAKIDALIKMVQMLVQGQGGQGPPPPMQPKGELEKNPESVKEPEKDDTPPEKGEDKKEILDKKEEDEDEEEEDEEKKKSEQSKLELASVISEVLQKDFGLKRARTPDPGRTVVHPSDVKDSDVISDINKVYVDAKKQLDSGGNRLEKALKQIDRKKEEIEQDYGRSWP